MLKKGGNSSIVQNAIGDNMTFDKFKDILMQAGINLFPDDDAFCYCEGMYITREFTFVIKGVASEASIHISMYVLSGFIFDKEI